MPQFPSIGRILIGMGVFLIVLGAGLSLSPKAFRLGRLPGDILIKREGFLLYIPITSSLLIGLFISLIIRIFRK
ncbi:MAG: DUF2905 domain-containing protein [Firmicutes bacterium]|nr:DUF2905 domain-containing protein [Bacillota bacterium]